MNAAPFTLVPSLPRQPPANLEAEQALLGAVLVNNRAYERAAEHVGPEHFAEPLHGELWRRCAETINAGHSVTPVMLRGAVEDVTYLDRLAAAATSVLHARDYAVLIHDLATRRALIALASEIEAEAYEAASARTGIALLEDIGERVYRLSAHSEAGRGPVEFSTSLARAMVQIEAASKSGGALSGLSTGFADLDTRLGGMQASDLIILAGRPSMGKSALARAVAVNAALAGSTVMFFSLEQSAEQHGALLIGERAQIPASKLRHGVAPADLARAAEAAYDLARALGRNLVVDDTGAIPMATLRSRTLRVARRVGAPPLALVIVDHIQLIGQGRGEQRRENRTQELTATTAALKALAKEMNVPVLALSQLSRGVESREDKRPQLSDLRESGSIEQDADVVMLMYREQYYLEREEPKPRASDTHDKFQDRKASWEAKMAEAQNKAEVHTAKQRMGPVGMDTLYFDPALTKFGNLARGA